MVVRSKPDTGRAQRFATLRSARLCLARLFRLGAATALAVAAFSVPARAVIFFNTSDPTHNTTEPTGELAGSGWQWVGRWGGFTGTVIGPHHFLAARHVGGNVGDTFEFRSASYRTISVNDDTTSDLRLWEVDGEFPDWAPLYRDLLETGQPLIVIGRGLGRGAEVRVSGVLKGWQWDSTGGIQRWGRNTVAGTVDGGSYWGELIGATFDAAGGPDEAHLATGDSSGPVFINGGTGWKLAGIAAAVDGPFSTTGADSGFYAAIFDKRRLYERAGTGWYYWTANSSSGAIPSAFYATRVSVRATWIDSIAPPPPVSTGDVPLLPPGSLLLLAAVLAALGMHALRRTRLPSLP